MEIPKQKYTEEQIAQIEELVRELLEINETQNAQLIAFNAKLQNEEAKVRVQQRYIQQLEMAFSKVMEDQGVHTGVRAYLNQFNGSTGATGQTEEDDRMDEAAAAAAAATAAVAATAKATGASLVFDGC